MAKSTKPLCFYAQTASLPATQFTICPNFGLNMFVLLDKTRDNLRIAVKGKIRDAKKHRILSVKITIRAGTEQNMVKPNHRICNILCVFSKNKKLEFLR